MENRRSKQPNLVVGFLSSVFKRAHILGLASEGFVTAGCPALLMYPPEGLSLVVNVVKDERRNVCNN